MLCCGYTLTDFPISIRLTSLALWQSNVCPSASKATLMNMDKYFMWIHYEGLRNHNKAKHNKTVCIFLGIYCMYHTSLSCLGPQVLKHNTWRPGPWFNIKMSSYQYRKSHCGDKTVVRSSYLHNGITYTGKMSSLYWIAALHEMADKFCWRHKCIEFKICISNYIHTKQCDVITPPMP